MKIDLTELERLDKEATPGPWMTNVYASDFCVAHKEIATDADFLLIDTMRNALPGLLICAQALEAIQETIQDIPHKHPQMQAIEQVCKAALARLRGENEGYSR